MVDSVRFSIIENELNREEQELENISIEDDLRSISSESSGEGIPISYSFKDLKRDDGDFYDVTEIESMLRSLPNAEEIEQVIRNSNYGYVFKNIADMNVGLMIAVWLRHLEFAAVLLRQGGNPNAVDKMERSLLHYACIRGSAPMTRLLLHFKALPNVCDKHLNITPLHYAAIVGSPECINLLIRNGAQVNIGIECKSALLYAVQKNHIKCVNILLQYGANPNIAYLYSESPLHVAAEMGYIQCVKSLLAHGANVNSVGGSRLNAPLHLAAEDDFVECIQLLLEHGANINIRNADQQTPLHVACLAQSTETVELLLKHKADINLTYRDGRTALHASIVKETSSWDCTRMLLDCKIDVNKSDNFGYTPIHLAALNEFGTCVLMLIEYGADMTARTNGGITALSFIVRRTPEVIPKYFSKLDSSIKVNDNDIGDVDCEIKLDFRCLVPNFNKGETELLINFIEVGQKRILKHPLCETFLFLKWRRIRKYFLFSLIFHSMYVLLFTIYAIAIFAQCCSSHRENFAIIGYVTLFFNLIILAKEIFQLIHGFATYIRSWENWLQWSIILGVFLCACPHVISYKTIDHWEYHVAGIVMFLVWLELMMIVGRFPIFGLYVQMFTKVAANFLKFLLAYSCLILGFALSFCILFPNYKSFKGVDQSILKTFVMMIGELEFDDIFHSDDEENANESIEHPITAQIMFFIFLVLVTVILMNLMVGLAVSDIQGLQTSAGLNRLSRQVELVSRLESLLFSKTLSKFPTKILEFLRREALLRTSRYNLQLNIKPNDPREKAIPQDIMALIYRLVAERRDRSHSLRKKRSTKNLNMFKDSIEEIQLRRPEFSRMQTMRKRTVSDQPVLIGNDTKHSTQRDSNERYSGNSGILKKSNDVLMTNMKNQLNDLNLKVENLSIKIEELTKLILVNQKLESN